MRERGHTLLEVLVSVALLALALVPLLQLYPQGLATASAQQDQELLGLAASATLEELAQALRSGSNPASGAQPCPPPADVARCVLQWEVRDVETDPTAGWLRHLWVAACSDGNSNGRCDAGEPGTRYETRVTSR